MKKKVLYIGGFELPDRNAAAQRVRANARLLKDLGFEVSFIGASQNLENSPAVVDGFTAKYVKYPEGRVEWLKYITTFVSTKEIESFDPSHVVLYNFPAVASLKILKFCHGRGIKVIQDLTEWESSGHDTFREIIRKFDISLRMRYCMVRMDGVIAISSYLYNYYKDKVNTVLVPPTVDLTDEKWDRGRCLAAGDQIKVVYAGSSGYFLKDRVDYVISAMEKFPEMRLDIVGFDKEWYECGFGKIPQTIHNVFFHGRLEHRDAVRVVQEADFQLLIRDSSRKNNAGFPTKYVESMACCTPVIATLTSNLGDYLVDGENGFVVTDSTQLENVMQRICSLSSAEIVKMKENCRKDSEVFDYRAYKEAFIKIFKVDGAN